MSNNIASLPVFVQYNFKISDTQRLINAYEFLNKRSYVGPTYDLASRDASHLTKDRK